jgi:hypothetical protein
MTETPEPNERRHAQAPAEGEDTDADETPEAARSHTDEPSEGAEADSGPEGGRSPEAGAGDAGQKP